MRENKMTEPQDRPLGMLFTEVYRERGAPGSDSPRFRVQLAAMFSAMTDMSAFSDYKFAKFFTLTTGIEVPKIHGPASIAYRFDKLIAGLEIGELLDFITLVARFCEDVKIARNVWVRQVRYAIQKQNLAYEIDDNAGVHHLIDAAFTRSRVLTLECLAGVRFEAAHEEIEKAFDYLTAMRRDNKMAVVNVFLAAENVFKIATGAGNGLAKDTVLKSLLPLVQKAYADADSATIQAGTNLVQSFASWANACHPYRHGQSDQQMVAPPDEIAISLVTTGADFIRWLVELSKSPA